jgi:hypothetical protein
VEIRLLICPIKDAGTKNTNAAGMTFLLAPDATPVDGQGSPGNMMAKKKS